MFFSKRLFSFFVLITTLASVLQADCDTTSCQNYSQNLWQPRAFSAYRTREMIALQDHVSRENVLSFSTEYMQNFGCHSDRLGSLPFWSGTNTMTIGTNDGTSNLDAYQFGLGEVTKEGSITLNPKVQHVGGEMLWRVGHSTDAAGAYFQVKVPLGAMMIEAKVDETPAEINPAQDADWTRYPAQSVRFKTITEALRSDYEHREPDYKHGRLAVGRNSVIRCGDIEAVAGYNFTESDKGYFGAGFKVSCPTGNAPTGQFMLEPVFGRAGHWGVGAEIAGNYQVYESDDKTVHVAVRGDVLHLFSGRPSMRSFDLALNGPGSKYMLLQHYPVVFLIDGMSPNQTLVETRTGVDLMPAINITTVPVRSKVSVEGSLAVALTGQRENWNASLFLEFWGRAHETLTIDCNRLSRVKEENLNNYAVLGRQIDIKSTNVTNPAPLLHWCDPTAKINESAARQTSTTIDTTKSGYANVKDARLSSNRIPADHNVALDVAGAQASRALTGKVSAELGYTWTESELAPHFGLFGGVEFADKSSRFENLWSVGLQGSMVF